MKGETSFPLSQGLIAWNWRRSEDTMKKSSRDKKTLSA